MLPQGAASLDRVRADRLLSLVLLLQARGGGTARALAAELGVSVRTVYRDLEALSVVRAVASVMRVEGEEE